MAMTSSVASRPASPAPSQLPPVPASPSVFSLASTANPLSAYALPIPPPRPAHVVINKADLERSQDAYADLLSSAKSYRLALASLSTAASTLGSALEACARLKEARAEPIGPRAGGHPAPGTISSSFTAGSVGACTADTLLSASGVHHLVANHTQILSETVYRSFEVPLLDDLDKWRALIDDEDDTYQHNIRAQSKEVKRLEKEGLKLHKQRRRDVARFRAHLVELTRQLDGLTTLHADHARTLLRESQETSGRIVDASCSLVRAEVDIFESLARKGWSGGGIDDLLEKGQDLFAPDDDGHHSTAAAAAGVAGGDGVKLFSILPPKSILADSASAAPGPGPESSLLIEATDHYQSLTGASTATTAAGAGAGAGGGGGGGGTGHRKHSSAGDSESVFSADFNRPRNARPFSPQPIRRPPTDVTYDTLSGEAIEPPALLFNPEDDLVAGMTSTSLQDDDVDNDSTNSTNNKSSKNNDDGGLDEEGDAIRQHVLDEVAERESILTNEDSAHWEPHDPGEEVFHLRRRRTTQDSTTVGGILMGGRGNMIHGDDDDDDDDDDGDDDHGGDGDGDGNGRRDRVKSPGARVLGVEPSPESAWGSPGKENFAD